MSPDDTSGVDRRSFLKATGAGAAAVGLAGCTGGPGAATDTQTEADETATEGGDGETMTETATETETDTETPAEPFAVTVTQGQMPTTLDPQNHRSTPTDTVVLHAYEGLLARDREGSIQPRLATEFERVEEGRVRFTVRDGVTFQNGDDLTPEDVAFSVNRIVDSSVGIESPQAGQLAGVTGAEVASAGDRTVDVLNDGLNPIVFAEFASYCDVMQRAWVENNEQSFIEQNMMGTGPFQQVSYDQGSQVVLESYDDYWQGPAAVDELTFNAAKEASVRVNQLIEGETDLVVNVPPQEVGRVQNSESARIDAVPSTRIIFNGMLYNDEPFTSPDFRRAMNYAIDLESIVANVLSEFGDATSQPTLQGFFGYNSDLEIYPHDPDQAESLVESSGFAGAEITLHTPVGRYLKDVEIARAVANQVDQLSNVSCSLKQRDFGALAGELVDGDIETGPSFYLIGWGNATFDAVQTIFPLLTSMGGLTSYENDELDSLISESQKTTGDERDGLLQDANAHANEQAPWIFLNRQYSVYGASERIDWRARRDERINAYAMEPT